MTDEEDYLPSIDREKLKKQYNKLKDPDRVYRWIRFWQWMAVAAFCCGILVSGMYYNSKVADQVRTQLDAIIASSSCLSGAPNYSIDSKYVMSVDIDNMSDIDRKSEQDQPG